MSGSLEGIFEIRIVDIDIEGVKRVVKSDPRDNNNPGQYFEKCARDCSHSRAYIRRVEDIASKVTIIF